MSIIRQNSRISHHTLTATGITFSVPSQEDFTISGSGSWTLTDLAYSEIGVAETDGRAFIRIGDDIKEFQFTTESHIPQVELVDTFGTRQDAIEVDIQGVNFGTGIRSIDGPTSSSILFDPYNIVVHSGNGTGITYDADYSLTFVTQSLVTKGYVDSHVPVVNLIIDTTITALIAARDAGTLTRGTIYHITDSSNGPVWLTALDVNRLSITGWRQLQIVNNDAYISASGYLGVYDFTGGTTYVAENKVVWGGKIWEAVTPGTPGTDIVDEYNLSENWNLLTTDAEYYTKIFAVEYQIENDRIFRQEDDRGNVVSYDDFTGSSWIDITDWGYLQMSNNNTLGIFNNLTVSSGSARPIQFNNVGGNIQLNTATGDGIMRNTMGESIKGNRSTNIINNVGLGITSNNVDQIENNHVDYIYNNGLSYAFGQIRFNIGKNIYNNDVSGSINNNRTDQIYGNGTNISTIYDNQGLLVRGNNNTGQISGNSSDTIQDNSNVGDILQNICNIIDSNTNNGNINNNSGGGNILTNTNNGAIIHNIISVEITSNTNNGAIQWNTGDWITSNTSTSSSPIIQNKVSNINANSNAGAITNNTGTEISSNTNTGEITFNTMSGFITGNSNTGNIDQNVGTNIYDNSNGNNISYNYCGDSIGGNSNKVDISNNTTTEGILNNISPVSSISSNICYMINNNSNAGNIESNNVSGDINNNSNTGDIVKNSLGGWISGNSNVGNIYGNSGGCYIQNNSNGNHIDFNVVGYSIENNSNTGNINGNRADISVAHNTSATDSISYNIAYTIENN